MVLTLKKSKRLSAHRQQYLSMNCPGTTTRCERRMNVRMVTSFPSLHSLCRSNHMLKCKKHLTTTSNSCSFLTLGGTNPHVINVYYLCSLFPQISVLLLFFILLSEKHVKYQSGPPWSEANRCVLRLIHAIC